MNRTDDRLLPVALLCVQAAAWPGAALARGTVPSASALLVAALVGGVVTAALALRRTRPVAAVAVVTAACALGAGPLPTGAVAVFGTAGVALALFTAAAERDPFTAVLCVVTLAAWQSLHGITLHGLSAPDGLDLALTALLYAAACGSGLLVRRARRARRAAEHLLRRAEAERHRLPEAERRRMERELHDVSAHHLTAVVVTAGAALGLRDRRPELAAEALEFARETGREVTRALGAVRAPAPSREELPSPQERLRALVAGFRRLDQRVDCEIDALPDGTVADAAYGIVREALTNVTRHAPGAHTTVLCRYGDTRTDVVITSAAPPAGTPSHGAGLGSGRGQGFLRSRAREAGGTLTSGPTADGGWEVRATLPGRTAAPVEQTVPRGYRAAQLTAALGLFLQPLLPALVIRAESASSGPRVSAGVLFALLAAAQGIALLWLRRAPRTAFGTLLGLALLWPPAMALGEYGGPVLLPPLLSVLPTGGAVVAATAGWPAGGQSRGHPGRPAGQVVRPAWRIGFGQPAGQVGRSAWRMGFGRPAGQVVRPAWRMGFGRPAGQVVRPAWRIGFGRSAWQIGRPAWQVAAALAHATAVTAAVLDRGTAFPVWAVALCAAAGAALAIGTARWYGTRRGRRDRADRDTREERLAAWTEEAVREAWAERRRIATGLETTVLARTADMVAAAEAGRLDTTAERAREALAAMRALLDTVTEGEATPPGLRPQPTLQALDLLAHQCRATGRDVEIRRTDRIPERLPTAVDLAAYHAAETVLAAGGEAPALLELDTDGDTLTLTATGVPEAAGPALRERLAARIETLGGTLTTGPDGTLRLRLPLSGEEGTER